jgi:hypothetical protein
VVGVIPNPWQCHWTTNGDGQGTSAWGVGQKAGEI